MLDFEDFWERKLWHQLTTALDEFFRHPESSPQRLVLFKHFVMTFADKINQLKLVELGLWASQECKGTLLTANASAIIIPPWFSGTDS